MASVALVSIVCADRVGLVAAITGRLFDLGVNLGDTTFAVLGTGAEFTAVCEAPEELGPESLEGELKRLPELAGAKVTVTPFTFGTVHEPSARITHRIEVSGGDQVGLIARLAEIFVQFEANIVRLNAQKIPAAASGGRDLYVTRFAVRIPEGRAGRCLAAVANTAGSMQLACRWEAVASS
jgi:glycine cleavage system transcriptional repressor